MALVAAGANVDMMDQVRMTPLHFAARSGHEAVVRALLAAGAKINASTQTSGYTPLHYAVQRLNVKVVRTLVAAGADVNNSGHYGHIQTPLKLAERIGDADLTRALKKRAVARIDHKT